MSGEADLSQVVAVSMRALMPLMFQVAIFKARILWQAIRSSAEKGTDQTEKLVPQPQDATALGFLIWKA